MPLSKKSPNELINIFSANSLGLNKSILCQLVGKLVLYINQRITIKPTINGIKSIPGDFTRLANKSYATRHDNMISINANAIQRLRNHI